MIRTIDSLIRSNLSLYSFLRGNAVYLCRFFFLEEGFSFLREISAAHERVAIDVGSNDGTSLTMIKRVHPDVEVHSFDPIVAPRMLKKGVHFHQSALSNQVIDIELHIPTVKKKRLTQYASSDRERLLIQLRDDFGFTSEEVRFESIRSSTITLDSLSLKPFFIKVDVEGDEIKVIEGSIETIRKYLPILLIELQSFEKYKEMRDILMGLGYLQLNWPESKKFIDSKDIGTYTRRRNNYLWLPTSGSNSWEYNNAK